MSRWIAFGWKEVLGGESNGSVTLEVRNLSRRGRLVGLKRSKSVMHLFGGKRIAAKIYWWRDDALDKQWKTVRDMTVERE